MKTDIVLMDLDTILMVHGCFWHGCKRHYTPPSDNALFWRRKLVSNRARDARQVRLLRKAGWRVVTVWEHSVSNNHMADLVAERLRRKA